MKKERITYLGCTRHQAHHVAHFIIMALPIRYPVIINLSVTTYAIKILVSIKNTKKILSNGPE